MAIYHLSAQVISRGAGRSSVAAAAYRSAERLFDERLGRVFDFTGKGADRLYSGVLLPEEAPAWMGERAALWNAVEASEKRKDAQLAREVTIALPRELTPAQNIALACDFVQHAFVARGMIADVSVHRGHSSGSDQPHLHAMLTLRGIEEAGFGCKVRAWNDKALLKGWRAEWSAVCNRHLARAERDVQIDHRTLAAQGIDLQPQNKCGPRSAPEQADKAREHAQIAWCNGERLRYRPEIAVRALMHQHSTVTHQDIARFVHRHTVDEAQFQAVYARVLHAPQWQVVGKDRAGRERLTDRAVYQRDVQMIQDAYVLHARSGHAVDERSAFKSARTSGLSPAQRRVYTHLLAPRDLACVVGLAGSGKSYVLGTAASVWQAQRYSVQGVTLSGVMADRLAAETGMACETVARMLYQWSEGQARLNERSIVVVDEAGLLGSRQMAALVQEVRRAGAKLVCVGDPEQLQPIEAGAAFRAIAERVGVEGLTEVRRQQQRWQRQATEALAHGRAYQALSAYQGHGHIYKVEDLGEAEARMIEGWARASRRDGFDQALMLAYRRDEVDRLNAAAHAWRLAQGQLGAEQAVRTAGGIKPFSVGDRVMCLRNERHVLNVKNGTVGVIEAINGYALSLRVGQGTEQRLVLVDSRHYDALDYGYAMTVHKAQGVTVESVQVLASPHFDRHVTYVALSRHRRSVAVYWVKGAFERTGGWRRCLSRACKKDSTLDYGLTQHLKAPERRLAPVSERLPKRPGIGAQEAVLSYASDQALSQLIGYELTDADRVGFLGQYEGCVHLKQPNQTYVLLSQPEQQRIALIERAQCVLPSPSGPARLQRVSAPAWARGAERLMAVPEGVGQATVVALWRDARAFERGMGHTPAVSVAQPTGGVYRGLVQIDQRMMGLMQSDQRGWVMFEAASAQALTVGGRMQVLPGGADQQGRLRVRDLSQTRDIER